LERRIPASKKADAWIGLNHNKLKAESTGVMSIVAVPINCKKFTHD
jgi:hypothetical protein